MSSILSLVLRDPSVSQAFKLALLDAEHVEPTFEMRLAWQKEDADDAAVDEAREERHG